MALRLTLVRQEVRCLVHAFDGQKLVVGATLRVDQFSSICATQGSLHLISMDNLSRRQVVIFVLIGS